MSRPRTRFDQRPRARRRGAPPRPAVRERGRATATSATWSPWAFIEGFYIKPRIDLELLRAARRGPHLRSRRALRARSRSTAAQRRLRRGQRHTRWSCAEIFGPEHFYLELQDHGIPRAAVGQRRACCASHEETGLPLVRDERRALSRRRATPTLQDVLLCIQTGKTVDDAEPDALRAAGVLPQERGGDARRCSPSAPEALENTDKIAERCNLEFDLRQVPPAANSSCRRATTSLTYFKKLCADGFAGRYGEATGQAAGERLEYEMDMIEQDGLCRLFPHRLRLCRATPRAQGIPVGPGRGCAAGSDRELLPAHHGHRPDEVQPLSSSAF